MLEKLIEGALRLWVKSKGGLALKFVSPGFTGVPDRLVLLPGGKAIFVEVKQLNKKPSPRQKFVHKQLQDLGFTVIVLDKKEDIKNII